MLVKEDQKQHSGMVIKKYLPHRIEFKGSNVSIDKSASLLRLLADARLGQQRRRYVAFKFSSDLDQEGSSFFLNIHLSRRIENEDVPVDQSWLKAMINTLGVKIPELNL